MQEMQLFELLGHATLVVKIVLSLLAVMSLLSWAIIFTKIFTLASARRKVAGNMYEFQEADSLRAAIKLMGRDVRSPAYQVAAGGVDELNRLEENGSSEKMSVVMDNLRRTLRQSVSEQEQRLTTSLSFLATCANAAPFIGLFGTVWGIMHSFHSIGQMKTAALAAVAPGISEALVATAIGLAVAIPATVAYNAFVGKISAIEADLVNFAGVFLNRVQRELPHMDDTQPKQKSVPPRSGGGVRL